jgi:hypothetical protein
MLKFAFSSSAATEFYTRHTESANRRQQAHDPEHRGVFPGVVPETGTTLKVSVTSGPPIQLLGLLADDALGTVDPLDPSPIP